MDFFSVALHEIGHSLGLQHTSVKEAVMHQSYRKFEPKLHDDDKIGIQEIYGFKSKWGPNFQTTTTIKNSLPYLDVPSISCSPNISSMWRFR